jgi:membrane-bound metal-dependent hydrolase YbcI (DUF457 family)
MTWRTHVLSGVSSLWLLLLIPHALNPRNAALLMALAALGALLPDLDAGQSKIRHLRLTEFKPLGKAKPFAPLSNALSQGLGHRGVLHSLLGWSVIALVASGLTALAQWPAALALVLGYGAHLCGDACTRSGIPWLYPARKRYHLLPPRLRFVTGSLAEEALFPFLLSATVMLLLYALVLTSLNGAV